MEEWCFLACTLWVIKLLCYITQGHLCQRNSIQSCLDAQTSISNYENDSHKFSHDNLEHIINQSSLFPGDSSLCQFAKKRPNLHNDLMKNNTIKGQLQAACLSGVKTIYDKLTENFILKGENLKAILLKSGTRENCSQTFLQQCLKSLFKTKRKIIHYFLSCRSYTIIHWHSKNSTRKCSEMSSTLNKEAEKTINFSRNQ